MLPRIIEILEIAPYQILVKWSTGEIKKIDLGKRITEQIANNKASKVYQKLLEPNVFRQAKLDTVLGTLYWENLIIMYDEKNNAIPANFDICPDLLYSLTV